MKIGSSATKRMCFGGGPLGANDFFSDTVPTATCLGCLTYDADLDVWCAAAGGNTNHGIEFGVPPELLVELCNRVGAHPWLCFPMYALDPMTDYVTQLATYVRDHLDTGLVPRFECCNEIWNSIFANTGYARNKAEHHWARPMTKIIGMARLRP